MYRTGKYMIYREHMNLRARPGASSKILGIIPQGSCIEVKEVRDNWGKTEFDGKTGWCCISECFARIVSDCENGKCCYYEKCAQLEKLLSVLCANVEGIKEVIERDEKVSE